MTKFEARDEIHELLHRMFDLELRPFNHNIWQRIFDLQMVIDPVLNPEMDWTKPHSK